MTMQAADSALFQGKQFLVCGTNGPKLVEPSLMGLNPAMASTASYRGWTADYFIDDHIQLKDLYVFHDAGHPIKNRNANGPIINGVSPQDLDSYLGFNCHYKDLNLPISFTGGLLLGKDLIRSLLANMGYHPFWKFEEVHELIFQEGKLLSAIDKSQIANTIRQQHLVKGVFRHQSVSTEQEVSEWIAQSFSLKYQI